MGGGIEQGLGKYRIYCIAGSHSGILHMCTSRGFYKSAAGEARKYFSTLSREKKNKPAVLQKAEFAQSAHSTSREPFFRLLASSGCFCSSIFIGGVANKNFSYVL